MIFFQDKCKERNYLRIYRIFYKSQTYYNDNQS